MADNLDIKIGISFDEKVGQANLDKAIEMLQKNNKISLGFDSNSFNGLKSQIDILQKQFSEAFAGAKPSIKLIDQTISNISSSVGDLQKKQVTIINGETVKTIETVKNSLIETQKIINDFNKRKITVTTIDDSAKVQKSLYSELLSLQKNEFTLKGQMLGQDGIIKQELEKQLGLVKTQQTEVGKLINLYSLKNEDNTSNILNERNRLTSNLIIQQEKYNQSLNQESFKNSEGTLKQIYDIKEKLLKIDQADTDTISILESKLNQLKSTFSNGLGNLNSDNLLKIKQQEIDLEEKLNVLRSQKKFDNSNEEVDKVNKINKSYTDMEGKIGNLKNKYKDLVPKQELDEVEALLQKFKLNLMNIDSVSMRDINLQITQLNTEINKLSNDTRQINSNMNSETSWFQSISANLSKFGIFFGLASVVAGVFNEIKSGIGTVNELNSAINTINLTMDMSSNEMHTLIGESQNMAKQMGLSIEEVLNAVKFAA